MMAWMLQRPSHPSRVRGLKFQMKTVKKLNMDVAPFAGAWIEILWI